MREVRPFGVEIFAFRGLQEVGPPAWTIVELGFERLVENRIGDGRGMRTSVARAAGRDGATTTTAGTQIPNVNSQPRPFIDTNRLAVGVTNTYGMQS